MNVHNTPVTAPFVLLNAHSSAVNYVSSLGIFVAYSGQSIGMVSKDPGMHVFHISSIIRRRMQTKILRQIFIQQVT